MCMLNRLNSTLFHCKHPNQVKFCIVQAYLEKKLINYLSKSKLKCCKVFTIFQYSRQGHTNFPCTPTENCAIYL